MGMLRSAITLSSMLSRYFTRALKEFPCAAITTRLPERMQGAMSECQNGKTLSRVVFKLSVDIFDADGILLYLEIFAGWCSEDKSQGGGGMSYDLLQMFTCSFPYLLTVSCLSRPCKAP